MPDSTPLDPKAIAAKLYAPNEPCSHRGCLSHFSHPCDGCGRIAGRYPEPSSAELAQRFEREADRLAAGGTIPWKAPIVTEAAEARHIARALKCESVLREMYEAALDEFDMDTVGERFGEAVNAAHAIYGYPAATPDARDGAK